MLGLVEGIYRLEIMMGISVLPAYAGIHGAVEIWFPSAYGPQHALGTRQLFMPKLSIRLSQRMLGSMASVILIHLAHIIRQPAFMRFAQAGEGN